jgi:hypothetical protein
MEQKLLAIPLEERAPGCTDEKVKKYCRAFTRMFQYMNLMSHYCYQSYGTITDGEMVLIQKLLLYTD